MAKSDKIIIRNKAAFIFCPSCLAVHCISLDVFKIVGSLEKPTILERQNSDINGSSVKVPLIQYANLPLKHRGYINQCHFFIINGMMLFCSNSYRNKWQTAELPKLSDWRKDNFEFKAGIDLGQAFDNTEIC